MKIQDKINRYERIIWENQLPAEEEEFLYHLLKREQCNGFQSDPDSDYSLFLAYNAQQNGFRGYTEEQIRTFRDILQTYQLQKLRKIPAMSGLFKKLNENGITPVLVKGAAFLCYYAPKLPRMMGDIDLYIPPEQFDKAVALIYEMGFTYVNDTGYHLAVTSDDLDMDIHRYIYKNGGDIGSDIYERLIPCSFLGGRVSVLSPEDMLVHQLVNRGQDLSLLSHRKRHFKWIVDCLAIVEEHPVDPAVAEERARETNNRFYARLTLNKLVELFPDTFSQEKHESDEKAYAKFVKYVAKRYQRGEISFDEKKAGKENTKMSFRDVWCLFTEIWRNSRIEKIVAGSHQTTFGYMLRKRKINSVGKFLHRMKHFLKTVLGKRVRTKRNDIGS